MGYVLTARDRVAIALSWRPEWKAALLVGAAWTVLLFGSGGHVAGAHPHAQPNLAPHNHHDHAFARHVPATDSRHDSVGPFLEGWVLMSIAMMAPLALPAVGYVGRNTIRRRRNHAMAIFFGVYAGVWVAFGFLVLPIVLLVDLPLTGNDRVVLAAALAVSAVWQLSRWKRQALNACGRTVPLPPVGRRADAACARFAWVEGSRCIRSCWPLMVVTAVAGHSHLLWMAALTAFVLVEEWSLIGRRLAAPSAAALALAAGVTALGT